jgi:hypothetical protein
LNLSPGEPSGLANAVEALTGWKPLAFLPIVPSKDGQIQNPELDTTLCGTTSG